MIDVRAGGPGEVEIEIRAEIDKVNYQALSRYTDVSGLYSNSDNKDLRLFVWLDDKRAYELAQLILDCLQAKDDARREV